MATLGTTSKPGGSYHAFGGSSETNQEAELLTMPARGRILTVGQWVGGWSDAPRVRLCIWHGTSEVLLGSSAQITVANEGAAGPGNVSLYTAALTAPVELAKGATFYVGFQRHIDDAHQISTGASGTGPHYHGRSGPTFPHNLGAVEGPTSDPRRIGSYVANWETLPGAWVYRSGVWVEAETVQTYRSGSWGDADGVAIHRSGSWVDSE